MFGDFDWLYSIAHTAAQFVLLGVYSTGLVVCLRRWHLAPGMRWFAAGFLAMLIESVAAVGFNLIIRAINGGTAASSPSFLATSLLSMLLIVLAIGGAVCFVAGVRSLATTLSRQQNAVLLPADDA